MEYAYSKGVRAHRDLKPANIMISQDKTAKITDFGLAGLMGEAFATGTTGRGARPGRAGLSGQTMLGTGFGTPAYMPPEQFDNAAACDERSDIYSFGVVLYQMAAGGQLPFPVPMDMDWRAMKQLHLEAPVPHLDSPLFPVVQRCVERLPARRYQSFNEVRSQLEQLLLHQTGEVITPPLLRELEAWEWSDKGNSIARLGRDEEAIRCYDKALEIDPRNAVFWTNKGGSLAILGRDEEAIRCYDKALEIDPRLAAAWDSKGSSLAILGRDEEAIRCYDKALEIDPRLVRAWFNRASAEDRLGDSAETVLSYRQFLALAPEQQYAKQIAYAHKRLQKLGG